MRENEAKTKNNSELTKKLKIVWQKAHILLSSFVVKSGPRTTQLVLITSIYTTYVYCFESY